MEFSDAKCLDFQLKLRHGPPFHSYTSVVVGLSVVGVIPMIALLLDVGKGADVLARRWYFIKQLSKTGPNVAIITAWILMYLLLNLRLAMQSIAGGTWVEAKWGFGQAIAVLTWFPLLSTLDVWSKFWKWHKKMFDRVFGSSN